MTTRAVFLAVSFAACGVAHAQDLDEMLAQKAAAREAQAQRATEITARPAATPATVEPSRKKSESPQKKSPSAPGIDKSRRFGPTVENTAKIRKGMLVTGSFRVFALSALPLETQGKLRMPGAFLLIIEPVPRVGARLFSMPIRKADTRSFHVGQMLYARPWCPLLVTWGPDGGTYGFSLPANWLDDE